jgi:hypothetical protein
MSFSLPLDSAENNTRYYAAVDTDGNITGFYDIVMFSYDPALGLPYPTDSGSSDDNPDDPLVDIPVPTGFVRLTQTQWDTHLLGGGTWKWVNDDLELQDPS